MAEVVSTMVQVHVARARTTSSVNINDGEWEYLALRRAVHEPVYPNLWQVITGGIHPGETAVEAALRELREETGLESYLHFWTLPFVASFYSRSRDAVVQSPVFGVVAADDFSPTLSEEHQDYEWLSFEQCEQRLVIPAQQQATKLFHHVLSNRWDDDMFHGVYKIG